MDVSTKHYNCVLTLNNQILGAVSTNYPSATLRTGSNEGGGGCDDAYILWLLQPLVILIHLYLK